MRKKIGKVLLTSVLLASASYADSHDYTFDSNSLVGIEGGFSSFDVEESATVENSEDFSTAGFKIGAETEEVRMFISARKAFMSSDNYDFSNAYMYGAELQYKFNMMDSLNFFLGANIGRFNFEADNSKYSLDYFGGDTGFNYHINEMFDLEVGARLMKLQDTDVFDDIVTGYTSLILKYQMD